VAQAVDQGDLVVAGAASKLAGAGRLLLKLLVEPGNKQEVAGAALAFLVAGSITTIPAMAAVWGIVRWRVFLLYLGIGMIGAAAIGWLTNLLFLEL